MLIVHKLLLDIKKPKTKQHLNLKMVGKKLWLLDEILTEKQIHHILKQSLGDVTADLKNSEVKPAVDGIAGFLGDHMKVVLDVDVLGERRKVHLFVKRIPDWNKPKTDFINEFNFYRREKMMFKILEEINGDGKLNVTNVSDTES